MALPVEVLSPLYFVRYRNVFFEVTPFLQAKGSYEVQFSGFTSE
jgi:hypothetical protein